MCSIYGALGASFERGIATRVNRYHLERIEELATSRGRDGGESKSYTLENGREAVIGSWRATPTPEIEQGRRQPYDGIVHNGTIANDDELGRLEGEIDSEVLPRVLDRSSLKDFATSITRLKGSYAIAAVTDDDIFLACNYKPIYYYQRAGHTYFASLEKHLAPVVLPGTRAVKMKPYSVMSLTTFQSIPLRRRTGLGLHRRTGLEARALVIASAGLDSTCVAAKLKSDGFDVHLLHFQYGCRAETRESERIPHIAKAIGASWSFQSLPYIGIGGSSLLDKDSPIAAGIAGSEYAHEWVPARNLVMLAYATAYAEARGYGYIALGNNLEEAGAYPDNEEEFTILFDQLLDNAVNEGNEVRVIAPVGNLMKKEVVALGLAVGAPFELTWSCYKGGTIHCGSCGPCFMRRTAFERNGEVDPVQFEKGN